MREPSSGTTTPAGSDRHWYRIVGGAPLTGSVEVSGAKNSVTKLLVATLLTPEPCTLSRVPRIVEVDVVLGMLAELGTQVEWLDSHTVRVTTPRIEDASLAEAYSGVNRIPILMMGPLLHRVGEAVVPLPGGCRIGKRPVDFHLRGLRAMGAEIIEQLRSVEVKTLGLHGAHVTLPFPSVGATENLLMAGVLAKGTTVIDNAAQEPEIADLCALLTAMGARIDGAGTSTLVIEGVEGLRPVLHRTVPDRIVAGTWAIGALMTGGDVTIRHGRAEHLGIVLEKLAGAGAAVELVEDGFRVSADGQPRSIDVVTLPYPGFPTDLLPQVIALEAVSEGISLITENVFDSRFVFCRELHALGADLRTDGHHVVVRPTPRLTGASVLASDVRAGAALVLAGLVAEGTTVVRDVHHIDRGYAHFVENLTALGAEIRREPSSAAAA